MSKNENVEKATQGVETTQNTNSISFNMDSIDFSKLEKAEETISITPIYLDLPNKGDSKRLVYMGQRNDKWNKTDEKGSPIQDENGVFVKEDRMTAYFVDADKNTYSHCGVSLISHLAKLAPQTMVSITFRETKKRTKIYDVKLLK